MRIATPRPAYCASCFAHKDQDFVDMEAAYDGPVIPGSPPLVLNDLCICEDCIKEAARHFDFEDRKALVEELVAQVRYLQGELDSKDRQIIGLTATVEELKDHPLAKLPGKPALIGLSDEERTEITRRRYERNGTSAAPKNNAMKKKVTA